MLIGFDSFSNEEHWVAFSKIFSHLVVIAFLRSGSLVKASLLLQLFNSSGIFEARAAHDHTATKEDNNRDGVEYEEDECSDAISNSIMKTSLADGLIVILMRNECW
jgi:hypothetical protein